MMNDDLPLDRLYFWEKQHPQRVWLRQRRSGQSIELTWSEVADRVRRVARMLAESLPEPGSRIAIHSRNCADWVIVDLAIMMAGHVSVPLYPGASAESIDYILEHADVQLIFIGPSDALPLVSKTLTSRPAVAIDVCPLDCDQTMASVLRDYEPLVDVIPPAEDFVFTLMYTSGTTGNPKGVMHTLNTVRFAVPDLLKIFDLDGKDRFFSYLPLAHAAERIIVEMNSLYCGATVTFAECMDTFLDDLRDAEPTLFFAVPRLWQKFREGIESKISPRLLSIVMRIPGVRELLRNKVRQQMGWGRTKHFVTGSAPTAPSLQDWYRSLGMVLRDGYGMTENFIYGFICQDDNAPPGSVGQQVGSGEVQIAEGGEILLRSGALMKGYYREPEATTRAVRDGWLHTGDRGFLDRRGYLFLTGRIGDTFKTAKGKFIQPVEIEARLAEITALGQICVFGHGLAQPVAVASLAEGYDPSESVRREISDAAQRINDSLPAHERVSAIGIVAEPWTPDSGLLTPTLKLRRRPIAERFRDAVEAGDSGVFWIKD